MKKFLFVITLLLLTTSCDKNEWKEKVSKSISETGAPIIAKTFTCSNPANIEKYLYDKLMASSILKRKDVPVDKSLGSTLCVAAVKATLPKFVEFGTEKLPADWGCTGEAISRTAKILAEDICTKL